jgi:hypothetical protein
MVRSLVIHTESSFILSIFLIRPINNSLVFFLYAIKLILIFNPENLRDQAFFSILKFDESFPPLRWRCQTASDGDIIMNNYINSLTNPTVKLQTTTKIR